MFSIDVKNRLKQWNETAEKDRDYCQGLSLLVQASGNRSFLWSIRNPQEKKDFIDYQLAKYIRFAVSDDEKKDVARMDRQVKSIIKDNLSLAVAKDEAPKTGKREDHDSLPDDIKALYVENLDILRQMREVHMKLRSLTAAYRAGTFKTSCIDAERYPFLKQIIDLDKRLHDNWHAYDTYVPGEHSDSGQPTDKEDDA